MTTITSTDAPAAGSGTSGGKPPNTKREIGVLSGFAHVALILWALTTAGPLIWVILASFKNNTEIFLGQPFALPQHFSFQTYANAWSEAHVGRYFLNSVFVVALSTAGTMLFGSMAAYVLARYKFFGNRFIYYMFVSGLAFPTFMALLTLFPPLTVSILPMIVVYAIFQRQIQSGLTAGAVK